MASRLRSNSIPKISFFAFQDIVTSVTGILTLITLILALNIRDGSSGNPNGRRLIEDLQKKVDELTSRNRESRERLAELEESPDPNRLREEVRLWENELHSLSNQLQSVQRDSRLQNDTARQEADRLGVSSARQTLDSFRRELSIVRQTQTQLVTQIAGLEQRDENSRQSLAAESSRARLWIVPPRTPIDSLQPLLLVLSSNDIVCRRLDGTTNRVIRNGPQFPAHFGEALRQWNPDRDRLSFFVRPSTVALFRTCTNLARESGFRIGYDALEEFTELMLGPPSPPSP